MTLLSLFIEDRGSGWFDLEVRNRADQIRLEWISDISDPWGDLARVALVIVTGGLRASVDFEFEPGIKRLEVERGYRMNGEGWTNRPRLRVFDRGAPGRTDGEPIFETLFRSPDECGQAILDALRSLLDRQTSKTSYGHQGFPDRAMSALAAALAYEGEV